MKPTRIDTVSWLTPDGSVHFSPDPGAFMPGGKLRIIDQRALPGHLEYLAIDTLEEACDAIKTLAVRGAPAIGCAAALALAAITEKSPTVNQEALLKEIMEDARILMESRPTAVNLAWAINRCTARIVTGSSGGTEQIRESLLREALSILEEDIELCARIGEHGKALLHDGMGILTHCNAGALAAGGDGTALAPIYAAHTDGIKLKVFSDETRPLLQGARLTAWELKQGGVDVTTICDNMAAQLMREGRIHAVIVGADRIAANGDTANKIGTYSVAIAARYHRIPFYVATPYSTFDMSLPSGDRIPIEQRAPGEVTSFTGVKTAPDGVSVYNPAFDVTPNSLIQAFITDRGVIRPPFLENLLVFQSIQL